MSQTHGEQPATSHRDPSSDAWWRKTLDAAAATTQLRAYEETGKDVSWSDAVMNASAAASWGWRDGRNLPSGPVGDLANGFATRLAEEYMREENIPHQIDNHESLPNVRAYMARGDVDETLRTAATSIVESADRGAPGEYKRPDQDKIAEVRNAMSDRLLNGRFDRAPADGPENFGRRLGYETADAGVQAINRIMAESRDNELARSVQHTLGAQPAPMARATSTGEKRNDGAAAGPAHVKSSTGLGARS